MHGIQLVVVTIAMIFMSLYAIRELYLWRAEIILGTRLGTAYGVFWGLVLTYTAGKCFQNFQVGPEFYRYHLNDLGFVAAWGGIILNIEMKSLCRREFVAFNKRPIITLRMGLSVALIAALMFEYMTAHDDGTFTTQGLHYSGQLDYMDITMYLTCFVAMWLLAPWMYEVRDAPAVAEVSVAPAAAKSRAQKLTPPTGVDPKAMSRRTTPKGTRPQPARRKR